MWSTWYHIHIKTIQIFLIMNIQILSGLILTLTLTACGSGSGSTSNSLTPSGVSNPNTAGSNSQCTNKFTNNWNSVKYWENKDGNPPPIDYVATGGGKYVVAGWTAGYSSSDAETWKVIPNLDRKYIHGLIYGQGLFVALGGTFTGNGNSAYISSDGVSWSTYLINGKNGISKDLPVFKTRDMAYGNNKFVVLGSLSSGLLAIFTSNDGFNWKKANSFPYDLAGTAHPTWISFANGVFYMGGSTNLRQMFTSVDGENWNSVSINGDSIFPSGNISGMQYIAGQYVSVDNEGVIAISKDAINWRSISKNQETLVAFGNSIVIGAGHALIIDSKNVAEDVKRVYTSCDGIRWASAQVRIGNFGYRAAIGDSGAVILNAGIMYTSRF